ncbi:MAG: hypothetical protein H7175_12450 [Burkholderiales bacterium]|nr:hypothetical protein [Anaerolineae bacterium]
MRVWIIVAVLVIAGGGAGFSSALRQDADAAPTLADFWDGRAEWVLDVEDVGLPIGESDTVYRGDGVYWSYLHASDQSAGIIDQCGQPVEFPGCLTRWESSDGGETFALSVPVCEIACTTCPCSDERDHITAQQYPRVAFADDAAYLMYEWHAHPVLRTSTDGLNWSDGVEISTPSGTWPSSYSQCSEIEHIGPHPNIRGEVHDCLLGAPPGVYVEGDMLYVFVAAGSAPGHMRCYKGDRHAGAAGLRVCESDPLFAGAAEYGPLDVVSGPDIAAYFDFRYVSSADVLRVDDHYYMAYEGVRGPDVLERGMDTQFGLGFARSVGPNIDGAWEKFLANPVLMPTSPNFGVGHADLLVVDGVTIMYTATTMETRGRYVLAWLD